MIKKCIILLQLLISISIVSPFLHNSIKGAYKIKGLSDEQRKEKIYGEFYASMRDYIAKIPNKINAVMMRPPGENAQFFWVLNYYFLPRKIYTFPEFFLLNKALFDSLNIGFILVPKKTGFYFKRYQSQKIEIPLIFPEDGDTIDFPPAFKWVGYNKGYYKIHICDAEEEKMAIECSNNQYQFPYDLWTLIPEKSRIYWYVEEVKTHSFSKLSAFYKR